MKAIKFTIDMKYNKFTIISVILCLCAMSCSKAPTVSDYITETIDLDYSVLTAENHPRVIFTDDVFLENKILYDAGTNPYFNQINDIIIANADSHLSDADLERVLTGKRLLTVCREAEERILSCAYAYKVTGEEKYLEHAEHDLVTVCNFSDWNAINHTLDIAEMGAGVGLAYDWLYNDLSADTKKLIRTALNDFMFTPCLEGEVSSSPYTVTNNWNAVCNGGLIAAALAVYEDNENVCQRIIKKSLVANILGQEAGYYPDGVYPEGYTYWDYGTTYEALLLGSMETTLGSDNGLSEIEGFSKTGLYAINMMGSSGRCYNYSDASETSNPCPAQWFIAWRFGDTSVLFLEKDRVSSYGSSEEMRLMTIIAYFASKVNVGSISAPADNIYYGAGDVPIFLAHDTWTMDENDKFLGIKGGQGNYAHSHLDAGSFVYDAEGLRWSAELGMENYTTQEEHVNLWSYANGSTRWTVFRYNNFNHSTVTVNDSYFDADGFAEFTEIIDSDGKKGAVIDLSDAIGFSEIYSAVRTIYMEGDDLVVEDEYVALNNKTADIRWTMVTKGSPTIKDNYISLLQSGVTRYLTFSSSTGHEVEPSTWSTESPNSWDRSNSGYYECGYTLSLDINERAVVTVRLSPTNPE